MWLCVASRRADAPSSAGEEHLLILDLVNLAAVLLQSFLTGGVSIVGYFEGEDRQH